VGPSKLSANASRWQQELCVGCVSLQTLGRPLLAARGARPPAATEAGTHVLVRALRFCSCPDAWCCQPGCSQQPSPEQSLGGPPEQNSPTRDRRVGGLASQQPPHHRHCPWYRCELRLQGSLLPKQKQTPSALRPSAPQLGCVPPRRSFQWAAVTR